MKFVEIYKIQNDGSQKIIATCKLVGESVLCEGDELFIGNLEKEGISDYLSKAPKKLFTKDGVAFLENLQFAFKSGYLVASEIKEETQSAHAA